MSFLPPVRSYYLLKLITSGQNGSHRHSESTLCWHGFRLHNSGSLLSCFYLSSLSQLLSYLFVYLFTFTSEKKCKPFFYVTKKLHFFTASASFSCSPSPPPEPFANVANCCPLLATIFACNSSKFIPTSTERRRAREFLRVRHQEGLYKPP